MPLPGAARRPEAAQDGGDSEDEDGTEDDASMGGSDGQVQDGADAAMRQSLESVAGSASGDEPEDALRTMWTRAEPLRPLQLDGNGSVHDMDAQRTVSIDEMPSASSSEAAVGAQPEAGGSGVQRPAPATPSAMTTPRRGRAARRGPKRCRRCGRFLKKESWIRSITRSVSKTLTSTPWGRRRTCKGCDRPMRNLRRASRGRSRSRSMSRRRSSARRGRSSSRRSRSRSRKRSSSRRRSGSRRKSSRRRRRRRSIDDQKFFVC